MNKDVLNYTVEKTKELINVPFCSSEVKSAALDWLNAVGTENEAEETKKYISELEAGILSIDEAIAFAESDKGIEILGADEAKNVAEHSKRRRLAGEKYCGCLACSAALEIKKSLTQTL